MAWAGCCGWREDNEPFRPQVQRTGPIHFRHSDRCLTQARGYDRIKTLRGSLRSSVILVVKCSLARLWC